MPMDLQAKVRNRSGVIDFTRFSSPGVSDSLISPRDLLKVTVASGRADESPLSVLVRVGNDGAAKIPLIGSVHVAGMEAYDASQSIVAAGVEGGIYVQPYVTVEIESKAVRSVTVLGAVNKPGVYELPYGNCNLVTALAAAGGLTTEAGTEVQIIRQPMLGLAENKHLSDTTHDKEGSEIQQAAYHTMGNSSIFNGPIPHVAPQLHPPEIVYLDLAEGLSKTFVDTRLGDRDIVKISSRTKDFIFVTGLVTQPGQFEMPLDQDIHLLDAIAMAGGTNSPVADTVLIIRREDKQAQPIIIKASLSKAKKNGLENIRLAASDTISIEQSPATVIVDTFNRLFRVSLGLASGTAVF
ncbi:MAG: SLBB domain-containing protein [Planctomycetes bacterium]|nr:SLBB domain-containing protein [Planctomycetota bacterium]